MSVDIYANLIGINTHFNAFLPPADRAAPNLCWRAKQCKIAASSSQASPNDSTLFCVFTVHVVHEKSKDDSHFCNDKTNLTRLYYGSGIIGKREKSNRKIINSLPDPIKGGILVLAHWSVSDDPSLQHLFPITPVFHYHISHRLNGVWAKIWIQRGNQRLISPTLSPFFLSTAPFLLFLNGTKRNNDSQG